MKLRVARKFDKVMLDRENLSDFIKFIYEDLERQLCKGLMDKLEDHKPYAVRLSEPKIIEDVPESWWPESEAKQDLVCINLVQCKNCKYNPDKPHKYYDDDLIYSYIWCPKFIEDLNGNGFCPYGKEIDDE